MNYSNETLAELETLFKEQESYVADIQQHIKELNKNIDMFDPREFIEYEQYDEFLDECNDLIKIGNLEYYPSKVLEEIDPMAYSWGFDDFADSVELESIPEYQCLLEQLEEAELNLSIELETLDNLNDAIGEMMG